VPLLTGIGNSVLVVRDVAARLVGPGGRWCSFSSAAVGSLLAMRSMTLESVSGGDVREVGGFGDVA
jgi:hypothetical protein